MFVAGRGKPVWRFLRMVAREAWCLAVTQPVRPLFRCRRRLGNCDGGEPIVFVHGYGQNCATFWGMGRDLSRRGRGPLYAFNYWTFTDLGKIADRLGGFIDQVVRESGAEGVHLVCHSMGGLVALDYLRRRGCEAVHSCVTVATPHAGVSWRGPIVGSCAGQLRTGSDYLRALARVRCTVPVLSIRSEEDGIFFAPESASIVARGGRDVVLPRGGHLAMLFDRQVTDHVVAFIDAAECPATHHDDDDDDDPASYDVSLDGALVDAAE